MNVDGTEALELLVFTATNRGGGAIRVTASDIPIAELKERCLQFRNSIRDIVKIMRDDTPDFETENAEHIEAIEVARINFTNSVLKDECRMHLQRLANENDVLSMCFPADLDFFPWEEVVVGAEGNNTSILGEELSVTRHPFEIQSLGGVEGVLADPQTVGILCSLDVEGYLEASVDQDDRYYYLNTFKETVDQLNDCRSVILFCHNDEEKSAGLEFVKDVADGKHKVLIGHDVLRARVFPDTSALFLITCTGAAQSDQLDVQTNVALSVAENNDFPVVGFAHRVFSKMGAELIAEISSQIKKGEAKKLYDVVANIRNAAEPSRRFLAPSLRMYGDLTREL